MEQSLKGHWMPNESEQITDLTRGVYRRQYAGFLKGQRINSVSLRAEAWFWRLNAAADDFGNGDGEAQLMFNATIGRRQDVTLDEAVVLYRECLSEGLIREYSVDDETFFHVVNFERWQPAGKNGKRVRRFPASPWDGGNGSISDGEAAGETGGIRVNPNRDTASATHVAADAKSQDSKAVGCIGAGRGGIRVNPSESSAPIPIPTPIPTPTPIPKKAHATRASARSPASPAAEPPPQSVEFPQFPTVGNARTWLLAEAHVAELSATFPAVDVPGECRKSHGWIKADLNRRKTPKGMGRFLFGWMSRAQDRGRHNNGNGVPSSSKERVKSLLESRPR